MSSLPWLSRAAPPRPRAVMPALLVALVASGALGSCSNDAAIDMNIPNILIIVNVQGVLPDATSLEVRASLNGKSDPVGLNITNNTSQFALTLPNAPQSLGTLRIDGFGLDNYKCYQASGSVSTQLVAGNTYQELTLMLSSVGGRLCQLVVDLTGTGTVTSTPPGISCGGTTSVCSFGFPYGTPVTLAGAISAASYPVWSANCPSTGAQAVSCKIALLNQGEQHVAATFVPRNCGPSGFCQYNPLPSYYSLNGLWGSGPKDVWAVGALPASILHYDGNAWTVAANPNLGPLTKVWGSGATDAWALGSGSLLHYDGSKWTTVSGSGLTTFSCGASSGAANAWVAGDTNQVVHYDGSQWATAFPTTEAWTAMWANSATDLWGLGASGSVYHYTGQTPTKDASLVIAGKLLTSLWSTGATDVWAASATEVFRWDGTAWTAQVGDSGVVLAGIGGTGGFGAPDAFFAATAGKVFHHKGTTDCLGSKTCWSLAPTPTFSGNLRALWGSSATDLWAAGDFGGLMHFDGLLWKFDPSVSGSSQNLVGVFATTVGINASPIVSALATNQVVTYDSAVGVTASATLPTGLNGLYGVTVSGSTEIWAVGGANTILRSTDGKVFSAATVPAPTGTHTALTGVWITPSATASRSYFVIGDNGFISRWDAATLMWTQITTCSTTTATLKAIHGSGNNIYVVGNGGTLLNINLLTNVCTVALTTPPATALNSVFFDGTTAWLAGDGGFVAGYTPGSKVLVPVTSGTTVNLNGVWSGGVKNPVWVVGASGVILSCDAASCTPQPTGYNVTFRGVWGANPTDIWAVGSSGTILRLKM